MKESHARLIKNVSPHYQASDLALLVIAAMIKIVLQATMQALLNAKMLSATMTLNVYQVSFVLFLNAEKRELLMKRLTNTGDSH